jgi:hypothetical protein
VSEERNLNQTWTPPPQGWIKINTDGTFYNNSGEASAEIMARKVEGKVILTAWKIL